MADEAGDVVVLAGGPAHKLQSGRLLPEEVRDGDGGARRRPPGALLLWPAVHQAQKGPSEGIAGAGDDLHFGGSGDAGQGFAAEAQGVDVGQVLGLAQLARGVAVESHRQVAFGDALAVVGHTDEAEAASAHFDRYLAGPGVEAVLDQLLHHGRRPLHDLTGSYESRYTRGENIDSQLGELTSSAHSSTEPVPLQ